MEIVFNKVSEKLKRKDLRTKMPKAELLLWAKLKNKQLRGYKLRRQYGVDSYIIDFYCTQIRLAIKVDGDSHYDSKKLLYDRSKKNHPNNYGIKILRFTNDEVYHNIN